MGANDLGNGRNLIPPPMVTSEDSSLHHLPHLALSTQTLTIQDSKFMATHGISLTSNGKRDCSLIPMLLIP